ncbi:Basic-leucine zipper (bZIP) transcription factor family protein [Abeliophyllum distichum]|uniref:Basic-leucine zipper (BZIP) transcription factor family protein n=1 Tax=Abeliophyllum distichum TaxID=126358 RepID=A0ABD1SUZ8_9LAMI
MAQPNSKQPRSQNFNLRGSHLRSLSQTTFYGTNCLPPLSPLPPSESSLVSSNSNLKDASMEEIDVSSRGPPLVPSFPRESLFRGNDCLPPRKGHRRSNSDVPLGFSAMIQSSPQLLPISGQGVMGRTTIKRETLGNDKPVRMKRCQTDSVSDGGSNAEGKGERKSEGEVIDDLFNSLMNMDRLDGVNSSGMGNKDKDNLVSGMVNIGDNSNIESERVSRHQTNSREGVKRSAPGDIAPPARHYRSLSMDSAVGDFQLGEESPKLPTSLGNWVGQLSPSNSVTENPAKLNLDFGSGEFSEVELKKIIADERLAEIASSDPKRAKRILANRQSAARSKERKLRYISELEHKVQTLQMEATALSSQLTVLQKDYTELTVQNNELKFRLQSLQQQAQLRDALHDTLTAEVQRLKLANMELRDEGRTSNCTSQQGQMKHIFQMQRQQPNQIQRLSVATSTGTTTASASPTSA